MAVMENAPGIGRKRDQVAARQSVGVRLPQIERHEESNSKMQLCTGVEIQGVVLGSEEDTAWYHQHRTISNKSVAD